MGRVGVLILSWCVAMAALVRPAAAGDFPKNLAFLAKLPVVLTGECLFDSNGAGTEHFGPCEVRAARDASGGYLFYIMEVVTRGQLDAVQSFTLSALPVSPPPAPRQGMTVVVRRGMCSGQELGLEVPTSCDIVVFPDPAAGERIFLRFVRFPSSLRSQFFEVHRGNIILAERTTVRAPVREGGGDDALALGRTAPH